MLEEVTVWDGYCSAQRGRRVDCVPGIFLPGSHVDIWDATPQPTFVLFRFQPRFLHPTATASLICAPPHSEETARHHLNEACVSATCAGPVMRPLGLPWGTAAAPCCHAIGEISRRRNRGRLWRRQLAPQLIKPAVSIPAILTITT